MTKKPKLTPRDKTRQHIERALATGVRGELRDALLEAQRLAMPVPTTRSLTDLHYKNMKPGGKLLDTDRQGLLMRYGKRKGQVWIFRFRDPITMKQVEYQFGYYPEMSVSKAREIWDELRIRRNRGENPAETTIEALAEAKPLTVGELVEKYIEEYARPTKRSWKEDKRLLGRHLVPTYSKIDAVDFSREDAAKLLHKIHKSGTGREAEKVRAVLSTMYNVATGKTRKISTLNGTWLPPGTPNPTESVLLPKRTQANHKPTAKELSNYMQGLADLTYGDLLKFQALTMARITEVTGMNWDEIDLENGVWTLPASRAKNGNEHVVLLTAQALEILIEREKTSLGEFVFPAPKNKNKPVNSNFIQHQLAGARGEMELPDTFKSHSLRHAALTWCAENGCPKDVRDRLTNHVLSGGVDAVYNSAQLNQPAKDWWAKWADHLGNLASPNVINIASTKAAIGTSTTNGEDSR